MPIRKEAEEIKYRLRIEAGLTLAQFAERIERDPSTVSMVINGRRTGSYVMQKVSETLNDRFGEPTSGQISKTAKEAVA